jgi:hypothetical protein
MKEWQFIALLYIIMFGIITAAVLIPYAEVKAEQSKPVPVLDCHEPRIQAGVPVKRLSDGEIVKIDVCGAADSADDTYRWKSNE